jgi:aminomethyltransferase
LAIVTNLHPPSALARTPLYDVSIAQNARMTAFSGWEMPVQYEGISREHHAVRTGAGMFDISHMGKFRLSGKDVLAQIQPLVPSDLSRSQPGEAQYTVLLNSEGGIIDDLIFYNQGTDAEGNQQWVVIVNAATTQKDWEWMRSHLDLSQLEFQNHSTENVLIALQGPQAAMLLQPLLKENLAEVKAFGHWQTSLLGESGFIARTGYTGEDGFEIMVSPEVGVALWSELQAKGVVPCGLGARDTLRLEAAMALYGQDIDDTTTPLEAGLGWLVHLDSKGDFIGRSRLEQQKQQGVKRRLVGLQMQGRAIARHGYLVLYEGRAVGEVTSGTQSPTLGTAIALAYVPTVLSKPGQVVDVEVRGKAYPAIVVKRPFYRRQTSESSPQSL